MMDKFHEWILSEIDSEYNLFKKYKVASGKTYGRFSMYGIDETEFTGNALVAVLETKRVIWSKDELKRFLWKSFSATWGKERVVKNLSSIGKHDDGLSMESLVTEDAQVKRTKTNFPEIETIPYNEIVRRMNRGNVSRKSRFIGHLIFKEKIPIEEIPTILDISKNAVGSHLFLIKSSMTKRKRGRLSKLVPKEELSRLVDLRMNNEQIGAMLGLCSKTIYRLKKKYNLERNDIFRKIDSEKFKEGYLNGEKMMTMCGWFGVSKEALVYARNKMNLPPRKTGRPRKNNDQQTSESVAERSAAKGSTSDQGRGLRDENVHGHETIPERNG